MKKKLFFSCYVLVLLTSFANMAEANSSPLSVVISPVTTLGLHFLTGTLIEIIVGGILLYRYQKGFWAVILANFISYPVFALLIYNFISPAHVGTGLAFPNILIFDEIFVVILEAIIISAILKGQISFLRSALVSLVMNISSFIGGFFLVSLAYQQIFSWIFPTYNGF